MTKPPLRTEHRINAQRLAGEVILKDYAILAEGQPLRIEVLDAVMLGPGATISGSAVSAILSSGCSIIWESKSGVASFTPAHREGSGRFAVQQARVSSIRKERHRAVRRLMQIRFGVPAPSSYTEDEIRGWEGSQMAALFARLSMEHNVEWHGRDNEGRGNDFSTVDDINKALSLSFAALYREIEGLLLTMGMNPALGIFHKGSRRAFVFDLAELYRNTIAETVFANFHLGLYPCVAQVTAIIPEIVRPTFVRYVEELLWDSSSL